MAQDFHIDQSLGHAAGIVCALMKADLESRFQAQGYDITAPQWALLFRLWEKDGISQKELSGATRKDKTNVARMVSRLERRGLVERRRDKHDARIQRIYLTPAGKQTESDLTAITAGALRYALRGIPQEAVDTTRETLWRVIENLAPKVSSQ